MGDREKCGFGRLDFLISLLLVALLVSATSRGVMSSAEALGWSWLFMVLLAATAWANGAVARKWKAAAAIGAKGEM